MTLNFAKNLFRQLRRIHLLPAAAMSLMPIVRGQQKLVPLATFSSLALAGTCLLAGRRRAVCDEGLGKDQLLVVLADLNKGIFQVMRHV